MPKRIELLVTQKYVYDPLGDTNNHEEWCELTPKCDTLEKMLHHDQSGLEDGEYTLEDLTFGLTAVEESVTFNIVEVDE